MKIKCMSKRSLTKLQVDLKIVQDTFNKFTDVSNCSRDEIIRMLYLEVGNINQVLESLVANRFKLQSESRPGQERNYISNDISEILTSDYKSELGRFTKSVFVYNKTKRGWTELVRLSKELQGVE